MRSIFTLKRMPRFKKKPRFSTDHILILEALCVLWVVQPREIVTPRLRTLFYFSIFLWQEARAPIDAASALPATTSGNCPRPTQQVLRQTQHADMYGRVSVISASVDHIPALQLMDVIVLEVTPVPGTHRCHVGQPFERRSYPPRVQGTQETLLRGACARLKAILQRFVLIGSRQSRS